jgi:hypothetical protein
MSASLFSRTIPFALFLILLSFRPSHARAAGDDDRTALAAQVLELAYSPENLRASFSGFLEPALDAMKKEGMPDAARAEMRKAFTEWFNEDVKWAEIKPQLVKIYAHDFTEEELKTLLVFLQKPLGQKVMAKLPLVMQDGALAGQQYFMSKQDSLKEKLDPIVEKYKSKTSN